MIEYKKLYLDILITTGIPNNDSLYGSFFMDNKLAFI